MQKNNNGINILICGSQRFDDKSFVFGMLDAYNNLTPDIPIANIVTSKFSGACQFAREWVSYTNDRNGSHIGQTECAFDDLLETKNLSLYEQVNIPDFVIKEDPFFQKGKEKLQKTNVNLVMLFPNPEKVLGASTLNIQRFAHLAGITCLDSSEALHLITSYRQTNSEIYTAEETTVIPPKEGLVNRHPGKKF